MRFVHDIIERRILRYVVAYCAGAWAGLELVDQLVGNDVLPALTYKAVLTLALCGLPGALIVSWFHGAKGRQEMPRIERWLLGAVVIFALGTTGFMVRAPLNAGPGSGELPETQDPSRVAVLYLGARGGSDAEFLASGVTEALIDALSEVDGLTVVSRNGSQLFRGHPAPPDSIGSVLRVGALVDGTVALSGDQVRVDIALTSAHTGEQITSARLIRPRSEIFALQDLLADTVAVFLRRAIGKELGARTLRLGTRSMEAWELVQQAGTAGDNATQLVAAGDITAASRALARADSLLASAEVADPAWPEPVIRRGWLSYRQSRLGGMDRNHNEKWIATGLSHAERALAAASRNPSALELKATLTYWGFLLNLAGTPEETDRMLHDAEALFRAAIMGAGGRLPSAQNSLSHLLIQKGESSEALTHAREAYSQDPFLENAHLTLWRIFQASWNLQDNVQGKRYCEEGARRFPHDFRFKQCQLMLPTLPGIQPDIPKAWAVLEEFTELSPPQVREVNRRRGLMFVSMALASAGLADSARAVVRSARAGADIDPLRELAHLEAITWVWLGEPTEAVRQLSLYVSANPQQLGGLRKDAAEGMLPWYFDRLKNEPAFRSLVGVQ